MPNLVGTGLNQVPTNGMLGGLAYQSPDHASIKDLDLKYLSQINASTADTAVDVFVYDTSRDTDGGAWRKRTQHTSWYNETLNTATRGSRREFPAVAVIVAEVQKITIYDGDDPDLPMWMVFDSSVFWGSSSISSCVMINGELFFGINSTLGVRFVKFLEDKIGRYSNGVGVGHWPINIAERSENRTFVTTGTSAQTGLVNGDVNDVAMTVLPTAPIDPDTGLQVPTIAVATEGGVSVIKDDGTVVSSAGDAPRSVEYLDNNYLIITRNSSSGYFAVHNNHFTSGVWNANAYAYYSATIPVFNQSGYINGIAASENGYFGNSIGVHIYDALSSSSTNTNGLFSNITTSYNTGWMHGDIKGAFLSDTDATNVTGTELVTNGTFDTNTNGWTAGFNASLSVSSSQLVITNGPTTGSSNYGLAAQSITTVIGKTYVYSARFISGSIATSGQVRVGTYLGDSSLGYTAGTGTISVTFKATGTTTWIGLLNPSNVGSATITFDDASVRIADPDRSVNNNGLQVFGTVTKSAVATGAELVAYSGFSASNYLMQPYNSDLDVGTGDISVIGWFKSSNSAGGYFFERMDPARTGNRLRGYITNSTYQFLISTSAGVIISNQNYLDGTWHFYSGIKRGSVMYLYVDGRLLGSADVGTNSITNTSANLSFGIRSDTASHFQDGNMALWRVSASAPSAEQIKKIYEDEKVLFQENANATLYGSSDIARALAYDEKTNLLHVGTSSGRSDFNGLRRINNTTEAVTTAISAYDGSIAQQ
jgi:hypothetical protein